MVWGGHLLAERLGKPVSREPIGESWEVWEGDSVEDGPFAGETLQALAGRFPESLLGTIPVERGWRRFPLLTKFIDAQEPLSVQVHPDDRQARRLENQPNGKTEAWHIIAAKPGAWIIHGLTERIGAEAFRRRLQTGTADDLLHKVEAAAGETIFVPAGTVHAIGPGVLLHEVQQTSDVTYRLYDWNRPAERSKRQLHLDKGLDVARLAPSTNAIVKPLRWTEGGVQVDLILASRYFVVKKLYFPGFLEIDTQGESFHIATVLSGGVSILAGEQEIALGLGQSAVLPACTGRYRLTSGRAAEVLIELTAALGTRLMDYLAAVGVSGVDAESFLNQFDMPG